MTSPSGKQAGRDRSIARSLESWFATSARDLPWRRPGRKTRRDPYRTLVSELMLQQTQVSRVLEKFGTFLDRFPTAHDLAAADEADVLAAWSGLGYYRRARLLHAAAKAVAAEQGGSIPADHEQLLALPGIGRYTAGAIASLAFGQRQPIVDGNVRRVLMRLKGEDLEPAAASTERWAWDRAAELVEAAESPGDFNESLMELGATVCTPANPSCEACPVAQRCAARASGTQMSIPRPKPRTKQTDLFMAVVVCRDSKGRVLLERRGDSGLWAGMWQPPTVERTDRDGDTDALRAHAGVRSIEPAGAFTHTTTHRIVRFSVYEGRGARARAGRRWFTPDEASELALSNPIRKVLLSPPSLWDRPAKPAR